MTGLGNVSNFYQNVFYADQHEQRGGQGSVCSVQPDDHQRAAKNLWWHRRLGL